MLHSSPIFENDQNDSPLSHVRDDLPPAPDHFEEGNHMSIESLVDVDLKFLSTPKIVKFGATASPSII